jgi:hypothetical protein
MLLHPLDEYPLHQAAAPLRQPADGDPNRYDRYFFHGYDVEAGYIFVVALGLYPNREIIDAAFVVSQGGRQRSVFASGRATPERATRIGPVAVDVLEPYRRLRVTVDAPEQGLGAQLDFVARSAPLLEPGQRMQDRARVIMDSCRYSQFGRWEGSLHAAGLDVEVTTDDVLGVRDRSWGVRPLAGSVPAAPSDDVPGIWWLWSPLHLEDRCVHLAMSEDPDGARTLTGAAVLDDLDDGDGREAAEGQGVPQAPVEHAVGVEHEVEWESGRRWARRARFTVVRRHQPSLELELTPVARVLMRGAGYTHLEWGHGTWHGEEAVGGEALVHDHLAGDDFTAQHTQQVVRVEGSATGAGVLEQLHLGPHAPTGLEGFCDPPA